MRLEGENGMKRIFILLIVAILFVDCSVNASSLNSKNFKEYLLDKAYIYAPTPVLVDNNVEHLSGTACKREGEWYGYFAENYTISINAEEPQISFPERKSLLSFVGDNLWVLQADDDRMTGYIYLDEDNNIRQKCLFSSHSSHVRCFKCNEDDRR